MFKKAIWSAALLIGVVGASAQQQVMLDKIVAVVGGSSILHSEVADYARRLVEQRRTDGYTSDRDPLNEALEGLLMQKLLYNQAQIDSVQIGLGDIQTRVEEELTTMAEEEGSLAQLEAKYHMAVFSIREMLRQRYEEQSYAQAMYGNVTGKVTIVPGEVERFYKNIDRDSLPMIPEQYVYAQITRFPKSLIEAKRRTRERLLELRERAITGQTRFDVLARMYSMDGSAARGGEIEPMQVAAFFQPFANALVELQPGQISEVVETQAGYHIIQLIDKKGDIYHCRHILLRPVYTDEELIEPTRTLDSIAHMIRTDSITFKKAAQLFSDDVASKMNGGLVSNHDLLERMGASDVRYTQTQFLKEDFANDGVHKSYDDFEAFSKLKPNEVSPAFATTDLMGNQMSKIVQLIEVIPAHQASLDGDYIRLEQIALQSKQEKFFRQWLNKKIDGMYVFIEPEFRKGAFENRHWVK
ncbi:MAG: peptidylprolyl isomerase [Alistipes sp.]